MNGFDAILIAMVFYVLPCLICIIAAFFDDDTWETFPVIILAFFPFLNIMCAVMIIAHYCAFKNEKTKTKETIEDKYDRLTKEAYND